MAEKIIKTNAIRMLDKFKIEYTIHTYSGDATWTGEMIANALNEDCNMVFKTLVTVSKSGVNYVFLVPVNKELDLKKAALSVNEKALSMLKSKELLPLTGYVHGGCSPIGMKKLFTTVVDSSAQNFEKIFFSGGKIGLQIETSPENLKKLIPYKFFEITVE